MLEPIPAQWDLPVLLETARIVREQIRGRVAQNRWFVEAFRANEQGAPWDLLHAEGGWYAVLRVPRVLSEEDWCLRLVREEGVLLHPGYFFDFPDDAYLVASLLTEEETFRRGRRRFFDLVERVCPSSP